MKTVLITGVSGLIGSKIYNLFHKDYNLFGLDMSNTYNFKNFIKCDLRQKDKLKSKLKNRKFDIVIHTAGLAHNFNNYSKEEIYESNFNATKNLIELIDKETYLIFLSTIGVYGKSILDNEIILESTAVSPIDDYSKSKLLAENFIKLIMKNSLILRCSPIFSDEFLVDIKKRVLYNNLFYVTFGGNQLHNFCHISTFLNIIKYFLSTKPITKTFNVTDGNIYKSKEIPKLVKNTKSFRINLPLFFITLISKLYLIFFFSKKKLILKIKFHKVLCNNLVQSSLDYNPNIKKINFE